MASVNDVDAAGCHVAGCHVAACHAEGWAAVPGRAAGRHDRYLCPAWACAATDGLMAVRPSRLPARPGP